MTPGLIFVTIAVALIAALPLWAHWSIRHDEKLRKEVLKKLRE